MKALIPTTSLLTLLTLATMPHPTPAAEPFTQTLTSTARNLNVESWETTSRQVTPNSPAWSIRKYRLHGGKQEGVDVIVVDNGKLQVTLCPTRGMGILHVTSGDVRLGWNSPVKEVVNPRNINLPMRGGLGWLEGFNEWMCRCGLEYAGHPGTDKFVNNVGDEATMDLTLHGRAANLPAQEVEVVIDTEPPYRLRVRGRVDERGFYGPKLELWTEFSTEPGSASFRVSDTLANRGAADQEFELIYHCNYGPPLLEEGATFHAAVERVTPFNARAAEGLKTWNQYAAPTPGFVEQVYNLRPLPGPDGRTLALLQNRAKTRGVSVRFSPKELPCLTLWKNTTAQAEGYVTGIEPGTNYAYNRRIERQAGRLQKLAPGATRSFTVDYQIHTDESQLRDLARQIDQLQSQHPAQFDEKPPALDAEH